MKVEDPGLVLQPAWPGPSMQKTHGRPPPQNGARENSAGPRVYVCTCEHLEEFGGHSFLGEPFEITSSLVRLRLFSHRSIGWAGVCVGGYPGQIAAKD